MGVACSSGQLEDDVDQGRGLRHLPVDSGARRRGRNARRVENKVPDRVVAVISSGGDRQAASEKDVQVILVDIPAGIRVCEVTSRAEDLGRVTAHTYDGNALEVRRGNDGRYMFGISNELCVVIRDDWR